MNGIVLVSSGPGRSRLVSANWEMPWAEDLYRIPAHTVGLVPVLEERRLRVRNLDCRGSELRSPVS